MVPWRSAPPSIERDRDRDRQTDRETDRTTDRQTHRHTDRQRLPGDRFHHLERGREREKERDFQTSRLIIVIRTTKIYISINFFY